MIKISEKILLILLSISPALLLGQSDTVSDKVLIQNFADELQCFKCSSDVTPSCATLFGKEDWEVEACQDGITECGAWVEGTVTVRGCLPEDPLPENLETCSEDLCNDSEWPLGRKKCNQCTGRTCVLTPGFETICENYVADDQCYVIVRDLMSAFRGCVSDDPDSEGKQTCSNEKLNEFCLVGDTNSQRGYENPSLSCVICTQSNDPNCITRSQVSLCASVILLGRPQDQCFTYFDTENLIRDCILTGANEQICEAGGPDMCKKCDTIGCNNERFNLRKCVQCDSTVDPNCIRNPELTQVTDCIGATEEENACFREEKRDNGNLVVRRDCVWALTPSEEDLCRLKTNNCKVCFEEECNKKVDFQECHTCDSVTDPNCVTFKSEMPYLTCLEYLDTCGTGINTDGHTIRSCSRDLPSTSLTEYCEPNRCNNQIVPRNRLSCHQCHATTDCALEQREETQEYCRIYRPGDSCYETVDSLGRTHRGCLSDPDANCGDRCNRCSTPNCNKNPSEALPTLSCITCTPSEPWCRWGFEPIQASRCISTIPIGGTEQCFLRIHDNNVAERGCTNDVANYCEGRDVKECITCDTAGCNGANTMQQSCVVCDSRDDSDCYQSDYLPEVKTCVQPGRNILQYANRGCFTLRDNDGYVQRGCFADLDNNWKENCQAGSRCVRCYEQNCNIQRPPNSGAIVKVSVALLLLLFIISLFI